MTRAGQKRVPRERLELSRKNEPVRSPTSDELEPSLPVTPLKTSESGRVPGTSRQRKFERQVERARAGIVAGHIEPKARPVAEHCQCAYRTALSILARLTDQGVVKRHGRGWSRVA